MFKINKFTQAIKKHPPNIGGCFYFSYLTFIISRWWTLSFFKVYLSLFDTPRHSFSLSHKSNQSQNILSQFRYNFNSDTININIFSLFNQSKNTLSQFRYNFNSDIINIDIFFFSINTKTH